MLLIKPLNYCLFFIIFMLLIIILCSWSLSCSCIIVLLFFYVCCLDFLSNLESPSSFSHGLVVYCYLVATQPVNFYQTIALSLLVFWTFNINPRLTPLNLKRWILKHMENFIWNLSFTSFITITFQALLKFVLAWFYSNLWIVLSTTICESTICLTFFYSLSKVFYHKIFKYSLNVTTCD